MKKFIIPSVILLTLVGCSASAQAYEGPSANEQNALKVVNAVTVNPTEDLIAKAKESARLQKIKEREAAYQASLIENAEDLQGMVDRLKGTVNRTWYVYSGATPAGWDCSGLVLWAYGTLGVDLEHRASVQANSGTFVKEPKVGDIVSFYYPGHSDSYHVGIYVSKNKMIHAPRPGVVTTIESITDFAGDSKVKYTRILKN